MGKKHKNLIEQIASKENILLAAQKAKKGNPNSVGGMIFMDYLESNIAYLSRAIADGSYAPGKPKVFVIYEPKKRQITALPFRDRVVQHAINNVIEPIFERTFYTQSYGCRAGRGTHKGAIACQAMMRRLEKDGEVWVLKTDFAGYFYNINRAFLHKRIRAKVTCKRTLELIEKYVPSTGVGIPIGNLTSQLFANVYGTIIDEWLLHEAKQKHFFRYMDDIVILGKSQKEMRDLQERMERFCAVEMGVRFSHWSASKADKGVNFLGYRIWTTHKLMRRQSVDTAKKKIKRYTRQGKTEELKRFLASWLGHAKWADSHNLIKSLERTYARSSKNS
ncbi:reverse transcriptase domain-containing protein [Marinomonas sp.]|uniref:reverse transcriptase domain-containing protein n=1 Tax=Marinomonas sp. TaxID=1904862 RepID=UPI003F9D64BF